MFRISGFTDEISEDFEVQLRAAKRLGLEYISLRNVDGVNIGACTVDHIRRRVAPLCKSYGIGISSIASPLGKVPADDDEACAAQLETAARIAAFSELLSCGYVRIFSFYIPRGERPQIYRDRVLERVAGLLGAFEHSGVTLLHENEKGLYGDTAQRCLDIVQGLRAGNALGLVFDPANFVQIGADAWEAFELLRPHVQYVHIKDALRGSGMNVPCGEGDGQIRRILAALKADGYDGFLTLEPHLAAFGGLDELERYEARDYIDRTRSLPPYDGFALQYKALKRLMSENQGG